MSKTILVIEDNEKHRFLLEDMLNDEGYEVVTATNGNEARQKADERERTGIPFDLIMVDLAVPDFYPLEFIERYKKKNRILVVSAYMDSFDLKGILDEKWKIKKPFDTNVLLERVKEILSLPKEARQ